MYASQKGDPGTTKLLLQYDADPNKRSDVSRRTTTSNKFNFEL